MLKLSDILVAHKEIESFEELTPIIQDIARGGERFFRIDLKPPYPDTPENWGIASRPSSAAASASLTGTPGPCPWISCHSISITSA